MAVWHSRSLWMRYYHFSICRLHILSRSFFFFCLYDVH